MVGYMKKTWLAQHMYVRDEPSVYLTYYYITYTTIYYYTIIYSNIHTFTYTNILCYILQCILVAYIYFKELQYNIVFNIRKKALNHRICYTDYIIILHYYLNSLNI